MFTEINIELTSRCNKMCHICNRWRDDTPKGDMDFKLLKRISLQLPKDVIVHFHNNGEPLLYERLDHAMMLFPKQIKQFDTNGILLMKRARDLTKVDIISVSIIQDDVVGEDQMNVLKQYLKVKPDTQVVVARCVGNIDDARMSEIQRLGIPIVKRVLHDKSGRVEYTKETIKPEDFICRDFMNHPAIDYLGNFSMCVKYDPEKKGVLGNLAGNKVPFTIHDIWYGQKRAILLRKHKCNNRKAIAFCANCDYYGYPNA